MRATKRMQKERNGAIDVYKFLLCWIIAFFHFYNNGGKHFPRGDLGVEFFVLISGVYFFAACAKMDENVNGGGVLWVYQKEIPPLFPSYICGTHDCLLCESNLDLFLDR